MTAAQVAAGVINQIAVAALNPDSGQPRRSFDAGELEALTESIRSRGVMQPLLVRSLGVAGYMIVDGERRWRAAKAAKLETVPAVLVDPAESLQQLRVDQVAVNELRASLSPLDLGVTLKQLRDEVKLSPNEIAAYLKKNGLAALTKQEVENLIGLTDLPAWAQKMVVDGAAEAKHFVPLRKFLGMPAVMKGIQKRLEQAINWGGSVTSDEVDDAIRSGLDDVGKDLTRTESHHREPVLFDWKLLKDKPYVVQHNGGAWCVDLAKFKEHQAEAKAAGLGPGGKRPKSEKAEGGGERKPTAAETKAKTQQRARSLKQKAEEYLHAYLNRALVPKLGEVAGHLMMFAALKRPNVRGYQPGAPGCHFPDGQEMPVEKLGDMKAAQVHKLATLDAVLENDPKNKRWTSIVESIARETLFELPFRETQVLAHHVLGDNIAKIWKLEPAFLDLFRKGELVNLAKKHKVPLGELNPETAKASSLKEVILLHPKLVAAPQILVDLYGRIEKPSRYAAYD